MTERVRLDRWLWAARFFRTRAQAKAAVEGGKVDLHLHPDGHTSPGRAIKPKVSKELSVGDMLTIRRGWTEETVVVRALSEERGNATAARTLYEETEDSVIRRQAEVSRRRMERAGLKLPERRPTKRDRRALKELKELEP